MRLSSLRTTLGTLVLGVLTVGSSASAQQQPDPARFIGQWQGTLQTPGPALRLGLAVRQGAAGTLAGMLTSPDQGNAEIPAAVSVRGDSLVVDISMAGATFVAALSTGRDSLRGVFSQAGAAMPLVLLRLPTPAGGAGAALAPAPAAVPLPRDESRHRSIVVRANGVRIHALDWGGRGTPLVFIPGFGNTAHVFDDFAPRFTDRHRVVGITRVGFGESEHPREGGYDLASRVAQIAAVLDSLGIARAVLVGHSLGGDEVSAFASAHPARTAGLVYLDAAYDHANVMKWQEAMAPYTAGALQPKAADFASVQAFQGYQRRFGGYQFPVGELMAVMRLDAGGAITGQRTSPQVMAATMAAVQPIDYSRVRAPVLALYSEWATAADLMPWLRADSAANARATDALRTTVIAGQAAERARVAREIPGARVETFRAHHNQFMSNPVETERYMRTFLATLPGGTRR